MSRRRSEGELRSFHSLACVAQLVVVLSHNQRVVDSILVREHAWVVGSVPSLDVCVKGNQLMLLSLFPSLKKH